MNVDPTKIVFVLVAALIILGPEKLPQVARRAGELWSLVRAPAEFLARQVQAVTGQGALNSLLGLGSLPGREESLGSAAPHALGGGAGFQRGSPELN